MDSGCFAGRYFPISFEAAKVVQTDHIHHLERRSQSIDPPLVSGGLQAVPAINRVSPELPVGAEIIGRYAGHLSGPAVGIEFKQIGIRPDIGAVVGHVDWSVPHHPHAAGLTITFQLSPLAEEFPLPEFLELHLARVRLMGAPFGPGYLAVGILERHESSEIVKPGPVLPAEIPELTSRLEIIESLPQQFELVRNHAREVHLVFRKGGRALKVVRRDRKSTRLNSSH